MNTNNSRVLITGASTRSAYAVMRSLSRKGIDCLSADTSKYGMCQFSRFSKGSACYKSFYQDESSFLKDIQKIIKNNKISIVIPTHNETEVFARNIEKFNPDLTAIIPNSSTCHIFNNKSLSYDLVESLGVPIPKRIKYTHPSELVEKIRNNNLEKTVIKLLTGNSSKGVFYANSPNDASKIVINLIKKFNLRKDRFPQVEEYVIGEGYGHSVLYWQGSQIANFTHRRLREKISTGGTSTFREASFHQGIEDAAEKIFRHVNWHGLAMSEFKVCSKTGKFWFIEVNPRIWGSISLAIESGVNFPYLAYQCATKNSDIALSYFNSSEKKTDWRAKWLLGEIFILLKSIFKLDFKFIINAYRQEKSDSFDDFYRDDLFVFFGQVISYLTKVTKKRSLNPSEKGMIG
tara:strand:+ start:7325 stop:8536 length:1212 start_codon:yes stop_codon:yes gene_type:complete